MGSDTKSSARKKNSPEEASAESKVEAVDTADSLVLPTAVVHTEEAARKTRQVSGAPKWLKVTGFVGGVVTLGAMILVGALGQYYKSKTMPNVIVAGQPAGTKKATELKQQLEAQQKSYIATFKSGEKELKPKLEEIGVSVDIDKTVERALAAKRDQGVLGRLQFWKKLSVPAVVSVNKNLLNQYVEANSPELIKPAQDARMEFDPDVGVFKITPQADGEGPNIEKIAQQLQLSGESLAPTSLSVSVSKRGPAITEADLKPLIEPANKLVSRRIVLSGLGYTYKATQTDIASWLTPTPKEDGSVKIVIDPGKIQSYVEGIGKKISSPPVDKKVVKDTSTGNEVVLQEGRDGTELADRSVLASAIAQSLKDGQDSEQTMNITTAAYKTVNMDAYEKWIEVDLSEQRTTAYERATPVNSYIISSGMRNYETVTGEFSIWLKVRSQTMTGGSRADGSYYNLPNVEWVSYFYKDYALHGAYWRDRFGVPGSHGCVNMRNEDAKWLWEWAPMGTKVIVHY